jgi:hypothetical protein
MLAKTVTKILLNAGVEPDARDYTRTRTPRRKSRGASRPEILRELNLPRVAGVRFFAHDARAPRRPSSRAFDFARGLPYKHCAYQPSRDRKKFRPEVFPFVKRIICIAALAVLALLNLTVAVPAQQPAPAAQASRDATREKLRKLLETAGARKDVGVAFRQSTKQPYNFVGVMDTGLTNCDSIEIVVGVTANDTIGFRIYPHFKGAYVNVDKAKDGVGLMRKLLQLSDSNFLFFGADPGGDVFSGYTFTLESGFPEEALVVVLRSIRHTDQVVGELRPLLDGSPATAK